LSRAFPTITVAKLTPLVLVGPTHPYTGGISQHTTRLALELERAGFDPVIESWRAQYPKRLYPGTPTVPDGEPEIGLPSRISTTLAWFSPLSWWLVGRRHRGSRIIVSIPTSFHALPYSVMSWAVGTSSEVWGIVHNVTPHGAGRLNQKLMAWFLKHLDRLIVHDDKARDDAIELGCEPGAVTVTPLPSPWPSPPHARPETTYPDEAAGLRVLFFGTVRPYKGLDLLLQAVAKTPDVSLTIAGEFWEDRAPYDELVEALAIAHRVTIIPGYLPASQFGEIFSGHDVLILPYRSGTGSIVREVGFRYGLPVIATTVGSIGDGIERDTTGLLIEPGSVDALVDALNHAVDPATRKRWTDNVATRQSLTQEAWNRYVSVVSEAL
jgi:glycosyltransferase involved in cell wall biosynthesis